MLSPQILNFDSLSLFGRRSVQLGAIHTGVVSTRSAKSSGKSAVAVACALDGERFAHDWAAATEDLEIGHATSHRRNIVAGGRGGE